MYSRPLVLTAASVLLIGFTSFAQDIEKPKDLPEKPKDLIEKPKEVIEKPKDNTEKLKDPVLPRWIYVVAKTAFEVYGHIDVSLDEATKGIDGRPGLVGRGGWMTDIASNLSYFGVRGRHDFGDTDMKAIFQFETQLDITATPGSSDNSSSADNAVKGALASRNSFLGLAAKWGAVKVGKTDTPYKTSTARMDPFSGTVGDYNAIMGNTGGDNRAEFDARLPHSIWYESPVSAKGYSFNFLYSPGQNRGDDDGSIPAGEPSCSGANNPIGGGQVCADGSFGDALSTSINFDNKYLYTTISYELHSRTNRRGDEQPGNTDPVPTGHVDIANEEAFKIGVQYSVTKRLTMDFIFEDMIRHAPDENFDERTRTGWWLAGSYRLNDREVVNLGWAHANKTPGDPGPTMHKDGSVNPGTNPPSSPPGPVDNSADLYSVGYQHFFGKSKASFYAVYATTVNQNGGHYDLGASGHGITTDCHDASPPAGGFNGGGGVCYAGNTLQAVSVGIADDF